MPTGFSRTAVALAGGAFDHSLFRKRLPDEPPTPWARCALA